MNKIGIILSREFFTRVKKKSFLLTTIGVPLVIMGFYALILYISFSGNSTKQKIAILDEGKLFNQSIENKDNTVEFYFIKDTSELSFIEKYKKLGYDCFLYISKDTFPKKKYHLHSGKSMSLSTIESIEALVNNTIRNKELLENGINPEEFNKISRSAKINTIIDTDEGAKKNYAEISYIVSFACGFLIYMMMVVYGTQVMRGVTEEKTNRIAEVMVSSVKPFELMMGKILGIGLVGLTQYTIWMVLMLCMQMSIPFIFPDLMIQLNRVSENSPENISMLANTIQGFHALPLAKILCAFLFYFLGGYLTYASIFAAVGSVVSEDQQEAQQLVFPVLMPIILGFVIMMKAVDDPNSTMAVVASIFPLTSPVVMMGRITYDIPIWEMALSITLLVGAFLFFTWLSGKIYRTGILMYGKKASWKEMIRWAFTKN